MLKYPPSQGLFFGKLGRTNRGPASITQVPVDFVGCFVKLANRVELDNLTKFTREDAKQFFRFPLRPDGF
jgi:hypothetical protein